MRRRSGFGWLEFIEGLLLILLGIFTCVHPGSILEGFVILYGLLAVVTGIGDSCFLCKDGTAYGIWTFCIPDCRTFKRYGRVYAIGTSGCRKMDHCAFSAYLVYRTLYFQAFPSEYCTLCGW